MGPIGRNHQQTGVFAFCELFISCSKLYKRTKINRKSLKAIFNIIFSKLTIRLPFSKTITSNYPIIAQNGKTPSNESISLLTLDPVSIIFHTSFNMTS